MSNDTFIHQKMITYLGNKRKLIPEIESIIQEVCQVLKKDKLNLLDGFAGSSVVSRLFTKYADDLYSNDEGILKEEDFHELFKDHTVKIYEIDYDVYKGSRNLKERDNKVKERMYLIQN